MKDRTGDKEYYVDLTTYVHSADRWRHHTADQLKYYTNHKANDKTKSIISAMCKDLRKSIEAVEKNILGVDIENPEFYNMKDQLDYICNILTKHVVNKQLLSDDSSSTEDSSSNDFSETSSRRRDSESRRIMAAYYRKSKNIYQTCVTSPYAEIRTFGKVFKDWFQIRFHDTAGITFFYKPQNIPWWVTHFIGYYGYCMCHGMCDQFESMFYEWCRGLGEHPDHENSRCQLPPYILNSSVPYADLFANPGALLIETIIRPLLYTEDFFPIHSENIRAWCEGAGRDFTDYTQEQLIKELNLHEVE